MTECNSSKNVEDLKKKNEQERIMLQYFGNSDSA